MSGVVLSMINRWFQNRPSASRRRTRYVSPELLEIRTLLSGLAPIAKDDRYAFDSLIQADNVTVDWDKVQLDVLRNDSASSGRLNHQTLTITSQPEHGSADVIQEFLTPETTHFFGFDGLVDDNSSPVGDGLASAVNGHVDSAGEIKLAVSSFYSRIEKGPGRFEEGDYRLFVRLRKESLTDFDPLRYDYSFDSRLVAPVDMPYFEDKFDPQTGRPRFQHFRIQNLSPGTPYIAWIDNTVGDGTPDTVLQKIGPWVIRYQPEPGFSGVDTIRYTVRDTSGRISDEAVVKVTIRNRAPVAKDVTLTTPRNEPIELQPDVSDADGTVDPGRFEIVSNPRHGRIEWRQRTGEGGTESVYAIYVPQSGYAGLDQLNYRVRDDDGAMSPVAVMRVNVTNAAPWANDDTVQVRKNGTVRIDVLANDGDSDGILNTSTLKIVSYPRHGVVVVERTPTGSRLKYTPKVGYLGPDTLRYSIRDRDGVEARAVVEINPAPLTQDDVFSTQENTAVILDLLRNDSALGMDLSLIPGSVKVVQRPTQGTVGWHRTNTGWQLRYTPRRGAASQLLVDNSSDHDDGNTSKGRLSLREAVRLANSDRYTDTFTYTVQDSAGITSLPGSVTVNVQPGASTIRFAPKLLRSARQLQLETLGDTSLGNSALVISSSIAIEGPAGKHLLTLSGRGEKNDLRHFLVTDQGRLSLQNLHLTKGGSDYDGGALYVQSGGRAQIINSQVSSNFAYDKGGAIFSLGSLNLTGTVLSSNTARLGGAIASFGPLVVSNSMFSSNTAEVAGALSQEVETGNLINSEFQKNSAKKTGGAIFNASTMKITKTSLKQNRADDGGALFNVGTVSLEDSTFEHNRALQGGGLMNGTSTALASPASERAGTVFLKRTSFRSNSAELGGAVYNIGDVVMGQGLAISNSAKQGGAFYNTDYGLRPEGISQLFLTDVSVSSNRATDGGGIYNQLGGITLRNSTLHGNSAAQNGGGIYSQSWASLNNVTIAQNSATTGGGLHNGTGSLKIDHSTIAGNSAKDGGGLFNDVGYVALTNTIVASNGTGRQKSDVVGRTPIDGENSHHNVIGTGGSGGLTDGDLNNQVGKNPLLGVLGAYGGLVPTMPLLPGSVAIDAGSGEDADARGIDRVRMRDVGAFESRGFTIQAMSPSAQSARVAYPFAKSLVIQVTAKQRGEPVSGGMVTFVGPGSGASATLSVNSVTLNRQGRGSVRASANRIVGRYMITAWAAGAPGAAEFVLTNKAVTSKAVSKTHPAQQTSTHPSPRPTGSQSPQTPVASRPLASSSSPASKSSLDWSKGYALLPKDQTQYRLNESGQLWRRQPNAAWTMLLDGVTKFNKAPNGDLYVLTNQHQVKKLQLGVYWTTLNFGRDESDRGPIWAKTFEISPNGQVFVLSHANVVHTFKSLDHYYVLPRIGDASHEALDAPTAGEVVIAAGVAIPAKNGFTQTVLTGEVQYFEPPADFPFASELAALLERRSGNSRLDPHPTAKSATRKAKQKWFDNIRYVVEPIADAIEPARILPGVGWAEFHRVQYKATIYGESQGEERPSVELHLFFDKGHLHIADAPPGKHSTSADTESASSFNKNRSNSPEASPPFARSSSVSHVKGTGIQESFAPKLLKGIDGTIYKMGIMDLSGRTLFGTKNPDPSPYNFWRLTPGGSWESFHDVRAIELGPDGTLFALSARGELQSLRPDTRHWRTLAREVQSFSMVPDGTLYALHSDKSLQSWRRSENRWIILQDHVREFAVFTDGSVYVLTNAGQLRRQDVKNRWRTVTNDVTAFVQIDDELNVLTRRGSLRQISIRSQVKVIAEGVQSIAAAIDGTLYAVKSSGELRRWTFNGSAELLHRGIQSIQLDPATGHLYVLLQDSDLKRLKYGDLWSTLQSDVSRIHVDAGGTAYVLDRLNRVTMYASRFETNVREPIDPDGPAFFTDLPSEYDIVNSIAMGGIGGAGFDWPDNAFNDVQYFPAGPDHNFFDMRLSRQSAWNNVRIVVEPIVDQLNPPRPFPNVAEGYTQLHHAAFKVTIYGSTLIAHPASDPDNIYVNKDEIQTLYLDQDVLRVYQPGARQYVPTSFGVRPDNPFDAGNPQTLAAWRSSESTSAAASTTSSVQRQRDELAQSLTMAPDGTLYKIGGGQNGIVAVGSEPGPHFLWRLPPRGEWQPIDYVHSFALDADSRLYFIDKDRVLKTPTTGQSEYAILGRNVSTFVIDRHGRQWMLTSAGALKSRPSSLSAWTQPESNVQALLQTPKGEVFTITKGHELRQWSGNRWRIEDRRIQSWAMLTDGTLWTLHENGQLHRRVESRRPQLLYRGIADFQVAPDGRVFAVSSRYELLQLTPRDHWTILKQNVRSFRITPNGDLYAIDGQRELYRLKLGQSFVRLQADARSMNITSDGTVSVKNSRGISTLYSSVGPSFVLGAIPEGGDSTALDSPGHREIMAAANLTSSTMTFPDESWTPLPRETAGSSESLNLTGLTGSLNTAAIPAVRLQAGSTEFTVPRRRVVRNVVITTEKMDDTLDRPRHDSRLGIVQSHRVLFKSTIRFVNERGENETLVLYLDHDHEHAVGLQCSLNVT